MNISTLLAVALLVSCTYAITPFSVPFLGNSAVTTTPEAATVLSVGQVITSCSHITSFTFWVTGPGGAATAAVAPWDLDSNTASSPITTVSVPIANSPTSYSAVTATLNLGGLDPTKAYVIYFVFPACIAQQFKVSTVASNVTGAYVQATNGYWNAGFNKDCVFAIVSKNTLSLVYTSYSVGTGPATNYNCYYNTTFKCIQVNWQTNTINTAYNDSSCVSTTNLSPASCPNGQSMLLGCSNTCWWQEKPFLVDLRGTKYKIADTWLAVGWPSDQVGTYSLSNNNQTASGISNGDCSDIKPVRQNSASQGGFYISILPI